MDVEGMPAAEHGVVAEPGAENEGAEGDVARTASSSEGQKGQMDLKHWLI